MANVKISELAELTTPATDDKLLIVDASEALDADKTKYITVRNLMDGPTFITTPLTSTAWDGDSFSTTDKTKIDLSAVFGAPAGVKAILARVVARDSGSEASATELFVGLSPALETPGFYLRVDGAPNDHYVEGGLTVPCNVDGDVYYEVKASGVGTMDVIMRIWGYWL